MASLLHARLQGATGHAEAGLANAQRAMALHEPSADEWLLVATLAADARRSAVAMDAIHRAEVAGAPEPSVLFATALLRYREGRLTEAAQLVHAVVARAPEFTQAQQLRANRKREASLTALCCRQCARS